MYTSEIILGADSNTVLKARPVNCLDGILTEFEDEVDEGDEDCSSSDSEDDSTHQEKWEEDSESENIDEDELEVIADEPLPVHGRGSWWQVIHGKDSSETFDEEVMNLDQYQLNTLIKLHGHEADMLVKLWRVRWEWALGEKLAAAAQETDIISIVRDLVELYILADRFGARSLRVRIIEQFHKLRDRCASGIGNIIPYDLVSRAFHNLPENSPLRVWLIHVFAAHRNSSQDDQHRIEAPKLLPKEFLLEVLFLDKCHSSGHTLDACYLHEHETWEQLKACRKERGKFTDSDALQRDYGIMLEDGEDEEGGKAT